MSNVQRQIDRDHVASLAERERERYSAEHPASRERFERSSASLFGGVPMTWMRDWPGGFPIVVAEATGTRLVDVDGHAYTDFCMGDTGATAGHAPAATVAALARQAARGITLMLPTDDGPRVAELLGDRFGLPLWQFALAATEANRNALRYARGLTGRTKILAFNHTYHGSVDDTLVCLTDGSVTPWPKNFGHPTDPRRTTKLVEFNDLDALAAALAPGDVACVITEPVLTGSGIVSPAPGFHDALRELTRRHGTLLIIDETHTLCTGPGGYTAAAGLDPDMITMGKVLAGGVPIGALGMSAEVGERALELIGEGLTAFAGIGGTLAGNALSLAAARATLEEVLTPTAFARMSALAGRLTDGLRAVIEEHGLPWHAAHLGCRVEYAFTPEPLRDNSSATAVRDPLVETFLHLHALNRGVLICPFHNLAQVSAAASEADVDRYVEVFRAGVAELVP